MSNSSLCMSKNTVCAAAESSFEIFLPDPYCLLRQADVQFSKWLASSALGAADRGFSLTHKPSADEQSDQHAWV